MGLNVEDPKVISDAIAQLQAAGQSVVNLAMDRLTSEVLPKLSVAADGALVSARQDVFDIVTSTMIQAGELVASLDGWTLDITIPPITIRLSKPKGPR